MSLPIQELVSELSLTKKKYKKTPTHTQNKRFCQNEVNIEEIEDGWDVLFDI